MTLQFKSSGTILFVDGKIALDPACCCGGGTSCPWAFVIGETIPHASPSQINESGQTFSSGDSTNGGIYTNGDLLTKFGVSPTAEYEIGGTRTGPSITIIDVSAGQVLNIVVENNVGGSNSICLTTNDGITHEISPGETYSGTFIAGSSDTTYTFEVKCGPCP